MNELKDTYKTIDVSSEETLFKDRNSLCEGDLNTLKQKKFFFRRV